MKFPSLEPIWCRPAASPGSLAVRLLCSVVIDADGFVYATGLSPLDAARHQRPLEHRDRQVRRRRNQLWQATYASQGEDLPWGIWMGGDDSIYVTGETVSGAEATSGAVEVPSTN